MALQVVIPDEYSERKVFIMDWLLHHSVSLGCVVAVVVILRGR